MSAYRSPTPSLKRQRKINRRRQLRRDYRTAVRNLHLHLDEPEDTDTKVNLGPLGHLNIEAELEGRGGIAKASRFAKKLATSSGGQTALHSAGVVPTLGSKKIEKNFTRDLIDLPAQTITSGYALGAGAKEAAQGRPQRLKKLGKQVQKHDPIYLAATGHIDKAVKEAEKHPLVTALEVTGVGKGASRLAGRATRPKPRVRTAPGTAIRKVERTADGAVGRAAKGAVHRRRVRRAQRDYQRANEAQARGAPARDVNEFRRRAAKRDPRRVPEEEVRKRYDQREALAEVRRRKHRSDVLVKADKALDKDAEAQLLVAQRIVKPTKESVRKYREQITRDAPDAKLTPAKHATNRRMRRKLSEVEQRDLSTVEERAQDYTEVVRPLQRELVKRGILDKKQERMAKLIPYAVQEMGAKWSGERLEIQGRSLKAREIEAHMRQNGINPDSVAFVSQHPRGRGAKNYYISWQQAKGIAGQKRTGEATLKGTFDIDREVGRENVARMQGLVDAHNEYSEFVKEFGYRAGGQKIKTFPNKKAADEYIADLAARSPEEGGKLTASTYEWRAVPIRPPFGRRDQAQALLDQADTDVEMLPVRETVGKALEGQGAGRYALVLDTAADQMGKHLKVLDPTAGGKVLRLGNRAFRQTVLGTNPAWMTGNVIEAAVRSAVAKAGPVDRKFAGDVVAKLRETSPKMAEELELRIGEGHFGMVELQMIHTTAEQFRNSSFERVARGFGAARRAPVVKQTADAWNAYTHFVFGKSGLLESQFKKAMLGQYAKQFLMDGKTLANWDKAVEQAASGLKGTNEQVAAAEWVRRAYGQYEAWGPTGRKMIANYTPFIAWTSNAVRFLVSVLPKDHPVLTGLLAATYRATEEWRHEQGQGRGIKGQVPGWLQGAVPTDKTWQRINRFTPFGIASDPIETIGGVILPQISGAVLATKGLDWKGNPLAGRDRADDVTDGEKAQGVLDALFGSLVPIVGQGQRAAGKEGSLLSKIAQTLNPFRGVSRQDPRISKTFDILDSVEAKKDAIRAKHPKVDSGHPTPEYERLHRESRRLNEALYRLSHGKYGQKYKTIYRPSGGKSGGGGGRFDFGGGDEGDRFDFGMVPGTAHNVRFDAGGTSGAMQRGMFGHYLLENAGEIAAERRKQGALRGRNAKQRAAQLRSPQARRFEYDPIVGRRRRRTNDSIYGPRLSGRYRRI